MLNIIIVLNVFKIFNVDLVFFPFFSIFVFALIFPLFLSIFDSADRRTRGKSQPFLTEKWKSVANELGNLTSRILG